MKILQINSVVNSGSTGRIAEEIGNVLISQGHSSYIAYGRGNAKSNSQLIKIGSVCDVYLHGAYTLLTDKHGFSSEKATNNLLKKIEVIKPDLIGLHNLHGYYINLKLLFNYIKSRNIPVVWTLFDCWAFTGHCTYFDDINCIRWQTHCQNCPKYGNYPKSWTDNSFMNYDEKKKIFTSLKRMELVTHSQWLADLTRKSYLAPYFVNVTPSAINLDLFKPCTSDLRQKYKLGDNKVILGCASSWTNRKGLGDFIALSSVLPDDCQIVMIGLDKSEMKQLPVNIIGISRT